MLSNIIKFGIPILALIIWASVFTVDERQKAILFKFGEILRSDYEPGLHFKMPIINNVRKFDQRILTIDQQPERFLTAEKKDLIVDSFVKWRIVAVEEYFKTTQGDEELAGRLLYQNINNGLRDEFGKRTVQEVIAGDRTEIMKIMTAEATDKARTLGIEVIDVRIKKIDLPARVSDSVYRRMRAERERVARDFRSKGAEAAERIRADADRQRSIILAEAYRDSEIVRGEGDARATNIYAQAFSKNEDFFRFHRSVNAYKNNFSTADDIILLEPDSEYFRYFSESGGQP
jgi:membrane protease subunit HflC